MRILIAEDQVLLREGLCRLFRDAKHEVVASLGDAERLLPAVSGHKPDLVVLDVRMPPSFTDEGTRAAREIKQNHPEVGVLVLSQHIVAAPPWSRGPPSAGRRDPIRTPHGHASLAEQRPGRAEPSRN